MKNFNISHTQITPLVRVSSAAIFYESESRFQVETIIFSKDERQRFRMWVHGSVYYDSDFTEPVFDKCRTFHRRVSRLLVKKLCQDLPEKHPELWQIKTKISCWESALKETDSVKERKSIRRFISLAKKKIRDGEYSPDTLTLFTISSNETLCEKPDLLLSECFNAVFNNQNKKP